ncbi:hypothetical protein EC957_005842 [Mortierella hygrophila]|uniref:N-acetyltransferase domain-containing protein n=1 Tax=Mortierella hygrophila TaxID=979708 RepID=A0A9P6EYS6_9FUNG|nr:hypothetical protein EC957_005842 [Mortierella hygrophila]
MSDRSWSPPLDLSTQTLQSLSIIRARPEHLPAIHKIQILAYPGRTDFHESEDVFRSKMEAYPAGNFVALATYSVVTHDDTSTWVGAEEGDEGEVEEVEGEEKEEEEEEGGGDGEVVHGISVVEITETGPDGSSTTTTATSTTSTVGGETVEHVDIVRARTPDILEGTDDEDNDSPLPAKRSTGLDVPHARHGHGHGQDSKSAGGGGDTAASSITSASAEKARGEEEEEEDTTVLFQWEEPVGYLFSHPYSRESVTLHRMGAHTATATEEEEKKKGEASSQQKRIRLEGGGTAAGKDHLQDDDEEESEGEKKYDHDQWMEKYYIHDCAIHPSWRGQGLASKLWKALEESLVSNRDVHGGEGASGAGEGASGDLVDTEEEEEEASESHSESANSDDNTASKETSTTRRRGGRRGSKKTRSHAHGHRHRRRKGAPNLKEIVLVSVQGTKPFWQRAGGFQVVADHDMDLSVYGAEGEAFLMQKTFFF